MTEKLTQPGVKIPAWAMGVVIFIITSTTGAIAAGVKAQADINNFKEEVIPQIREDIREIKEEQKRISEKTDRQYESIQQDVKAILRAVKA